jgi:hypothetical protein
VVAGRDEREAADKLADGLLTAPVDQTRAKSSTT